MNAVTYIPRTGSLADRVLGYLRANPDEELTTRDIAVKFDVPQSSIKPCLATAENHGELDYTRNEDLEYVYRLPKQPKAPKTPAPTPAEPAPAKTSKHSPTPGPRGPIVTPSAIEALAVEEDVDVAAANKRPGQNKWDPLMAKLTKAGQSIAIPQEWYRPLQSDAGSCRTCSKRTGANPDLFADVKGADVCTDPPCFKAKEAAHQERQLKAAREAGATIIEGREAKALVPHSWNTRIDGFLRLDEKEDSPGDKPLRALIGKLMEQEGITATLVANPHKDGDLIAVIDHSTAQRLLAKKGMQVQAELVEAKAQKSEKAAKEAQQAKDREKFENAWRWAVLQAAWAKIDGMEEGMYSVPDTLIRKLAIRHMPNSQDKSKRLATLLGVPAEIQPTLALRDWIEHHPDPDRALALIMMFDDIEWQSWKERDGQATNEQLMALATDTGVAIDIEAVKKQVKTEHSAAIKAREKAAQAKAAEAPEGSSPLPPAAQADGVRGEQSKKGSGKGGKGKKAPAAPAAARLTEDEARTGIAAAMQGDGVGADDGPEGSDPAVGDAAGGVDGRATSPDAGAAQPVPGARVRLVGETMTGRLGHLIERSTFHSMDKRFSGEPVTSWLVRIDGLTAEYIFELNEFEVISEEGAEA